MESPDSTSKRPNLLFVVVDCLRADRCPTDGDGDAGKLKAWPRLCRSGTAFSQTISSASWTPVCFASLLTGNYSFVHGVRTIRGPAMDPDLATLATVLRDAGYATHAFMTGPMIDVLGMNRGFDEYQHRLRDVFVHGDWGPSFLADFERICNQPKPWFVLLHLFEVHCPRQTNSLPAREHSVREYDLAWQQLDPWIDDLLDRAPPNTVVSLTADHGESIRRRSDRTLAGHVYRKIRRNMKLPRRPNDWRRHGYHVFEELVRIPWVISGPGAAEGLVIDRQVRQVDMAGTLLDVLGLEMPPTTHGRSVAPLMRHQTMPDEPAYVETGCDELHRDWHGLRDANWKYAEHTRTAGNLKTDPALYNLVADPRENRNVINAHRDKALELRRQLDKIIRAGAGGTESAGKQIDQDDQARLAEQLKALGYI